MIDILNYTKMEKGKIVAQFDIRLDKQGLIIRRVTKICSNDKVFYNMPTFSIEQPDGTRKFFPYVQFTNNTKEFFDAIGEAVIAYEKKQQEGEVVKKEYDEADLPF